MRNPFFASIEQNTAAPILCVGDVMLDTFIQGTVERISPEAPIPVFKYLHENKHLGGVGNVARNLAGLGIPSFLAGLVGRDQAFESIQELLSASHHITPALIQTTDLKTIHKTRFVSGIQQLLRVDHEDPGHLSHKYADALTQKTLELLDQASALVLSDYGKGALSRGMITALIQKARSQDKWAIVDPKGRDYSRYKGASLITPNRHELAQATHLPTTTDAECIAAANQLITEYQFEAVLVTRGAQGMTLVTQSGIVKHIATSAREVFDVSGAGDTVVAVLAATLAHGISLDTAIEWANRAGGIVVGKVGTAIIEREELEESYDAQEDAYANTAHKIFTLSEAKDICLKWQRRGLKVGFTNGCFDLLHPGHLKVLREAKQLCDRLIVGLNTDHSVRELKGPTRPIQNEQARAQMLAALEGVDGVVLFSEPSPYSLIMAFKPDVLVKGADYKIEDLAGAREVQGWGGVVHLVPLVPDQSTTRMVKKMA